MEQKERSSVGQRLRLSFYFQFYLIESKSHKNRIDSNNREMQLGDWCGGNILLDLNSRRELTYKSTLFPAARSVPYACSWDVKVYFPFISISPSFWYAISIGVDLTIWAATYMVWYMITGEQELPSRSGDDANGRTQSTGHRGSMQQRILPSLAIHEGSQVTNNTPAVIMSLHPIVFRPWCM